MFTARLLKLSISALVILSSGCGILDSINKSKDAVTVGRSLAHLEFAARSKGTGVETLIANERVSNEDLYSRFRFAFPASQGFRESWFEGLDFNVKSPADQTPASLNSLVRTNRSIGPIAESQLLRFSLTECKNYMSSVAASSPFSTPGLLDRVTAISSSENAQFEGLKFSDQLLWILARNALDAPIAIDSAEIQALRGALPAYINSAAGSKNGSIGPTGQAIPRDALTYVCTTLIASPQFLMGVPGSWESYRKMSLSLTGKVLTPVELQSLVSNSKMNTAGFIDQIYSRNRDLVVNRLTQWFSEAYGIDPTRLAKPSNDLRNSSPFVPSTTQPLIAFTSGKFSKNGNTGLYIARHITIKGINPEQRYIYNHPESCDIDKTQDFDPRTSMILEQFKDGTQWQTAGGWVERRFLQNYLNQLSTYVDHRWKLNKDGNQVVDANGTAGLCEPVSISNDIAAFNCAKYPPSNVGYGKIANNPVDVCWFLKEAQKEGIDFYRCNGYLRSAGAPQNNGDLRNFTAIQFESIEGPDLYRANGSKLKDIGDLYSDSQYTGKVLFDYSKQSNGIEKSFAASFQDPLPRSSLSSVEYFLGWSSLSRLQRFGYPSPTGLIEAQDGASQIKLWYTGKEVRVCNNVDRFLATCSFNPGWTDSPNFSNNIISPFKPVQTSGMPLSAWRTRGTPFQNTLRIAALEPSSFLNPAGVLGFRCGQPDVASITDLQTAATARFPLGHRFSAGIDTLSNYNYFANTTDADESSYTDRMWSDVQEQSRNLISYLILRDRPWSELFTADYTIGRKYLGHIYSEKGTRGNLPPTNDETLASTGFRGASVPDLQAVRGYTEDLYLYDLNRTPEVSLFGLVNGFQTTSGTNFDLLPSAWAFNELYIDHFKTLSLQNCWSYQSTFAAVDQCRLSRGLPSLTSQNYHLKSLAPGVGLFAHLDFVGPVTQIADFEGRSQPVSARTFTRRIILRILGQETPSALLLDSSEAQRTEAEAMLKAGYNAKNQIHVENPSCKACHAAMDPLTFAMFGSSRSQMLNRSLFAPHAEILGPYTRYFNFVGPITAFNFSDGQAPTGYFPGQGQISGLPGVAHAIVNSREFYEQTVRILYLRIFGSIPLTQQGVADFNAMVDDFARDRRILNLLRKMSLQKSFHEAPKNGQSKGK